MRQALKLHPGFARAATIRVGAEASREASGNVIFRYELAGAVGGVRLPAKAPSVRADELWRHTCFEAFIARPGGGYYEFNFSPSTKWAVYRFSGYREEMALFSMSPAPRIEVAESPTSFSLRAAVAASNFEDLPANATWRVGLSAIVEDSRGDKSYWALAHPPGKPDFHHQDCLALRLPPASRS